MRGCKAGIGRWMRGEDADALRRRIAAVSAGIAEVREGVEGELGKV